MRKKFKKFLKTSKIIFYALTFLAYCYLRLVYFTCKIDITWQQNSKNFLQKQKAVIFLIWHKHVPLTIKICGHLTYSKQNSIHALISSHSDGKIFKQIVNFFGFNVIEGSTNRNAQKAVKEIITALNKDHRIVITPDGPRGPAQQINSSIFTIAQKYNTPIIAASCFLHNKIILDSWDKMQIPLPFSKVSVIIGDPILPNNYSSLSTEEGKKMLQDKINKLEDEVQNLTKYNKKTI